MKGKIFAVGVGPGDPQLLTIKALDAIKKSHTIFVPKGREEGSSVALSIVNKVLDLREKEILEVFFPMVKTKEEQHKVVKAWDEIVHSAYSRVNQGLHISFLTLGDPTLYSTFFYIYRKLMEVDSEVEIELIPAVSSITACAAISKTFLAVGDEKVAILPAVYMDSFDSIFDSFDTIILMKVHRVFEKVLDFLKRRNLQDKAISISRAGMDGEKIIKNIEDIKAENRN